MNTPTNEYAQRQLQIAANRLLTPKEFQAPPKVYFHHHNGAKFHVDTSTYDSNGNRRSGGVMTLSFVNYRVVTDDKRAQDQLDLVADQPGTFIYTMQDSEARHIIENELKNEQQADILRTAASRAGDRNEQFDARVPIVPVAVHNPQIPMQQYLPQGTGMQNSVSGTQATEPTSLQLTTPEVQVAPPQSATEKALADLAAKTNATK